MKRSIAFTTFLITAAVLFAGAGARAETDSCREWQKEHCDWKAKAMQRYLRGATQRELDEAMFEILQREAYLTSCDTSAQASRGAMVGWRLVGRNPDEFASAVLESVLERSGFDVSLRSRLSAFVGEPRGPSAPVANTAMSGGPAPRRSARAAR